MLLRIRCEDLIAKEVLYHAGCMYHYVRHSTSELSTETQSALTDSSSTMDTAFQTLVDDLQSDLLVDRKVLQMSDVLTRFEKHFPPDKNSYTTQKLQNRLLAYYGDAVSIIPRRGQGQSNLILSSEITSADALSAAHQMKKSVKSCELELDFTAHGMDAEDITVLHTAAGMLRSEMEKITIPTDSRTFPAGPRTVPPLLSKFVA